MLMSHCDLTSTAIDSAPLLRGRHNEDPSTRWDKDILVEDRELLSARASRGDVSRYKTNRSPWVWTLRQ